MKMADYKSTSLWRAAFESDQANQYEKLVARLVYAYELSRERAKVLTSEIAIDLPNFTVHDIDHLDGLWEIGSQITGSTFNLNPVEGFVLGCSFLFHDAGMSVAAYPGGLDEMQSTTAWQKTLNRLSSNFNGEVPEHLVLTVFLREQHAQRAEALPRLQWQGQVGNYYLIEDSDLRNQFSEFIGKVAGSHWWNHERLEAEFRDRIILAPTPFPSNWSVDLLKLGCLLRAADAAQIDCRRSPGFLRSLRNSRVDSQSRMHWNFQNRLSQAQLRGDTLYFAAFSPFAKEEFADWWLLYDTLKLVDGELRRCDDLLLRLRGESYRFAARRVSNIETPGSLITCVPTAGWRPVDTSFTIDDIPKLVANLGGDQLYGRDSFVAIRELLQNAMDSCRIRKIVDTSSPPLSVEISIVRSIDGISVEVADNGIGMNSASLIGNLLSFGRSGWLEEKSIGEYSDLLPTKDSVSGRYGLGFFSVFMISSRVHVHTRAFDASPSETVTLEFPDGLNSRPILAAADAGHRMTVGGTRITLALKDPHEFRRFTSSRRSRVFDPSKIDINQFSELIGEAFPTSEVPIRVRVGDESRIVFGGEWPSEPVDVFLRRVEGSNYAGSSEALYETSVRLIKEPDGTVVGRAGLVCDRLTRRAPIDDRRIDGAITSHGSVVGGGSFRGVLLGTPLRASRDCALPIASKEALSSWASEQALILGESVEDPEEQVEIAAWVSSFGGDIGPLKFCEIGGRFVNRSELKQELFGLDEAWVVQDAAVSTARRVGLNCVRHPRSISVSVGYAMPIRFTSFDPYVFPRYFNRSLGDIASEIVATSFSIDSEIVAAYDEVQDGHHVFRSKSPIWLADNGLLTYADGEHYWRGMTLSDIESYRVERTG